MKTLNCALVTAGNGDLAEAVGGTLRELYPHARLHATELGDPWPAAITFDEVHRLPTADHKNYTKALTQTAENIGADVVIPCHDAELRRLALDPGPASTLKLMMPNPELIIAFSDKLDTAKWLADQGIKGPETIPLKDATAEQLPLIVKPRQGAGSKDIQLVRNESHLHHMMGIHDDDFIAQAFLPNAEQEFTCSLVRLGGQIRHLILRRRLDAGRTVAAHVVDNREIGELLKAIAIAGDLEGVLNVQLRLTRKGPMVFEINPRFSSTVRMRHLLGFSDLGWSIEHVFGTQPPQCEIEPGASVYRLSREVVRRPGKTV